MQEDSSEIHEKEALELIKDGFIKKAASAYLFMLSLGLLLCFFSHENLKEVFLIPEEPKKLKELMLTALLGSGILVLFLETLLSLSTPFNRWMKSLYKMLDQVGWKSFLPILFLAAISEEVFIRAALQPYLEGPLLTSFLYALFHLSPMASLLPSLALAFTTSFLLGVVFDFTGSVYTGIIIHLCFSIFSWLRLKPTRELTKKASTKKEQDVE